MKTIAIKAEVKQGTGRSAAAKARKEGKVPCVLYGGSENMNLLVDEKELNKFLYTPEVLIAEIQVEGGKTVKALVQDAQFHPISDATIHADFKELVSGQPVKVSLPIRVVGNSIGVRAGGKMKEILRKLRVKGMPENLPDFVEVDITNVNIGQSFRVNQLNLSGVEFLDSPSNVVVTVAATRATRQAAEEAAAAAAPAKKK
jgi:large subunit ribosomal protein L25